jgi:hypothetical protein
LQSKDIPNINDKIFCLTDSDGNGIHSGTGSDTVLKQTIMPIVDRDTCNKTEGLVGEIAPYMICAGWEEGKNDACVPIHYWHNCLFQHSITSSS